ncbi:MAG: hypothetical protein Terrestrivirus1_63 [Terrestrivirus sp.]|uniref:Uncharacterized protein n=1 Tax=Terrestrivirus sp. TaxID=2487775 RepID=A0A3G4ZNZ8_9VIRU|nr:MAG: hypothetical protein Terrestrivirus1_63 [Terrestrivirus sp.]
MGNILKRWPNGEDKNCYHNNNNGNNHICKPTSSPNYDYLIRAILCGPSKSGKTVFKTTFEGKTDLQYRETIGVDFSTAMYNCDNKKYKIQLWDTAGSIKFRSIVNSYFRGSNITFVLYKENEEEDMKQILDCAQQHKLYHSQVVVIRNKYGQEFEEIENYDQYRQFVMDVSDKKNIDKLFEIVLFSIIPRIMEFSGSLMAPTYNTKKPAIYIYSDKDCDINLRLNTRHKITKEIPERINQLWNCKIKNNELFIEGEKHPYIFWEAEINHKLLTDYEFVINRKNYRLLNNLLSLYLNKKELADFNEYWEPYFSSREGYVLVGCINRDVFDRDFPLEIDVGSSTKTVHMRRIELLFEEYDMNNANNINKNEITRVDEIDLELLNKLYGHVENYDIKIVEWGGTVIESK